MSTVPAALSALVAVLRASPRITALKTTPDTPGVLVQDGPWFERPSEPDVICIGWQPDEGDVVDLAPSQDLASEQESYDIENLASSWSGDTDLAARRARADALLEAVRAELRADPTLGGVVTLAELTVRSWGQFQTSTGCEVPIRFVIHVEAFRLD